MYGDKIKAVSKSSNVVPKLVHDIPKLKLNFSGNLLKQTTVSYNQGSILNIYIVYRLSSRSNNNPEMALENCLFGAVKITKHSDTSKYVYSGYGIGFDAKGSYFHPKGGNSKNIIIFGVDLSSSRYCNNKKIVF